MGEEKGIYQASNISCATGYQMTKDTLCLVGKMGMNLEVYNQPLLTPDYHSRVTIK